MTLSLFFFLKDMMKSLLKDSFHAYKFTFIVTTIVFTTNMKTANWFFEFGICCCCAIKWSIFQFKSRVGREKANTAVQFAKKGKHDI